jgi:hypothetical protein
MSAAAKTKTKENLVKPALFGMLTSCLLLSAAMVAVSVAETPANPGTPPPLGHKDFNGYTLTATFRSALVPVLPSTALTGWSADAAAPSCAIPVDAESSLNRRRMSGMRGRLPAS